MCRTPSAFCFSMENPSGNSARRRLDFPAGAVKQNVGWRPSNETIAPIDRRPGLFVWGERRSNVIFASVDVTRRDWRCSAGRTRSRALLSGTVCLSWWRLFRRTPSGGRAWRSWLRMERRAAETAATPTKNSSGGRTATPSPGFGRAFHFITLSAASSGWRSDPMQRAKGRRQPPKS
jgi:hypothetical protein